MISLEKFKILTPLQKLPKNVGNLGKLIVAKDLKKVPKFQKIAQSGHTDCWLLHIETTDPSLSSQNASIYAQHK